MIKSVPINSMIDCSGGTFWKFYTMSHIKFGKAMIVDNL